MANEIRARFNLVSGTLSGALTNVATSMSSAGLANLGVIDSTNHAAITIENEIVWVTAHTGGATTATILRGQEGTSAAAHSSAVAWQHGPTALDLGITYFNPPACRVGFNAPISIPNATETPLGYNTERYDTDTMHDTVTNNSRITIKTAGLYSVSTDVFFAANVTGVREVYLKVNNTTYFGIVTQDGGTAGNRILSITTTWKFVAGDYIETRVYQSSGGALNATNTSYAEMTATWTGLG